MKQRHVIIDYALAHGWGDSALEDLEQALDIEEKHPMLSLLRQCELVSIARSSCCYQPTGEQGFNIELMRLIHTQCLRTPWYGSRQISTLAPTALIGHNDDDSLVTRWAAIRGN